MMDLVILLSIALAVTAMLGLLFAGFVWTPWLIGLLLVVLLIVLMKVSLPEDPQVLAQLTEDGELPSSSEPAPETKTDTPTNGSLSVEPDPVMLYRGVKYQRKPAESTASTTSENAPLAESRGTSSEGKYRGHPWKRSV